jgi:alkylated DNA nucleotide flippase Atl1
MISGNNSKFTIITTPTPCKYLRGPRRESLTDLFDRNATQQQETKRQADRKAEIIQHWRGNILHNKQNNRAQARESGDEGFNLVADIYIDILSVNGLVSRTACQSLNQLSEWCLDHMSDAHGTTWPRRMNSADRIAADDPADVQEQEHWLARRGVHLVCDLHTFLRAFRSSRSPQLREECARILRAAADRCHREENACVPWKDSVGRANWGRWGDRILAILRDQFQNRNAFVSDAALDASYDLDIRAGWRAINYIED